jgi:hypothetical protein
MTPAEMFDRVICINEYKNVLDLLQFTKDASDSLFSLARFVGTGANQDSVKSEIAKYLNDRIPTIRSIVLENKNRISKLYNEGNGVLGVAVALLEELYLTTADLLTEASYLQSYANTRTINAYDKWFDCHVLVSDLLFTMKSSAIEQYNFVYDNTYGILEILAKY